MKILVCEDDEIMLKIIEIALEGYDHQAVYVTDGEQAIKLLRNTNFDLIITDIHMPYHNGDEILKLVREDQGKNTPIILISSDNNEEVINLALKSGANEYIVKPIDPMKLARSLKSFLLCKFF